MAHGFSNMDPMCFGIETVLVATSSNRGRCALLVSEFAVNRFKTVYSFKFDFIHFWSVTLVNTIKTTSFTPPSVIKLHLLFAHNNKKTKPTQKIIFRQ
jgi:hypothetical protein